MCYRYYIILPKQEAKKARFYKKNFIRTGCVLSLRCAWPPVPSRQTKEMVLLGNSIFFASLVCALLVSPDLFFRFLCSRFSFFSSMRYPSHSFSCWAAASLVHGLGLTHLRRMERSPFRRGWHAQQTSSSFSSFVHAGLLKQRSPCGIRAVALCSFALSFFHCSLSLIGHHWR